LPEFSSAAGLDVSLYSHLVDLLPKIENPNPILEIFEGRDDD